MSPRPAKSARPAPPSPSPAPAPAPAPTLPDGDAADGGLQADAGRLTMADLAAKAQVSIITVSRALRDSPAVREDTRRRIQELAREMGYRFNATARNLRLQRSHTIAVVVDMTPSPERPMSGPFPLDLLGGICQELTVAGYNVLLTTGPSQPAAAVQAADGAILLGQGADDTAVRQLLPMGVPLVVWGAPQPDMGSGATAPVFVGSDNHQGGALAAARLLETGRRRLVFLGDTHHRENAERLHGFTQTLAAAGAALVALAPCDFTFNAGVAAVRGLLATTPGGFDGIFACSDAIALGAMRALTEAKLTVPDDVSVIGYDDTPMAAFNTPALTSVHQNWTEGGVRLAQSVLALINGERPGSLILPTRLVVRAT
ncbi:LacI family DNA-binding transcriptional regulator [Nitrospirillum sp. BR 11828]|uniref:LacI family DNA-binding transcriptional regulator n=1 Tax=Nitrospirillum sp. BR 11828 TaxID=3104325 RepID=UPI002ACA7F18|nr:LacI family DNA-binding transcriptional regulator [Nitrospirillum sp. BR 11828]MDZ5650694.1 LacI family DNA-binding transcriptional regulator [Nitrospirillum sp. BR 11828]